MFSKSEMSIFIKDWDKSQSNTLKWCRRISLYLTSNIDSNMVANSKRRMSMSISWLKCLHERESEDSAGRALPLDLHWLQSQHGINQTDSALDSLLSASLSTASTFWLGQDNLNNMRDVFAYCCCCCCRCSVWCLDLAVRWSLLESYWGEVSELLVLRE